MKTTISIEELIEVLKEIDEKLGKTISNGSKAPMVNYHDETFSGVLGTMTKIMQISKDEQSPYIGYDDCIKENLDNWKTWQLITKNWYEIVDNLPTWLEQLEKDNSTLEDFL